MLEDNYPEGYFFNQHGEGELGKNFDRICQLIKELNTLNSYFKRLLMKEKSSAHLSIYFNRFDLIKMKYDQLAKDILVLVFQ